MAVIGAAAEAVWPGVPLVPLMEPGGTDGVFFRALGIPAFGVNHFGPDDDVRAHGRDERIGVREFEDAVQIRLRGSPDRRRRHAASIDGTCATLASSSSVRA